MQEIKNFTDYKLQLKERILEAAMKAFVSKGIKAVKMDDVAALLGISKRTLYEIYDDKETLVFEGVKHFHTLKQESIDRFAAENHNVLDIVIFIYESHIRMYKAINPVFYEDLAKYPRVSAFIEEMQKANQQNFMVFTNRGIEEGLFLPNINYPIIAHLFRALNLYMHEKRLYQQYSFQELIFNMMFVSLRGFCTTKGIEQIDKYFADNKQ